MKNILDDHLLDSYDEKDFAYYKNFYNKEIAKGYVELLTDNKIPYRLEGAAETIIDEAIVGTAMFPKIILKILPRDFKKVNQLIEQEILRNYPGFEGHYLNDMETDELMEVVKKPDEWSVEDVFLTKRILRQRGVNFSEKEIKELKDERLRKLQKGRRGNMGWMAFYLFAVIGGIFMLSYVFVIGGVAMGWYYWKDKTVDMEGNKYFTFEKNTRNFGFFILWLTAFIIITGLLFLWFGIDYLDF